MVSLFLLLGCNLSYIVDLFAALHELASASARTLLKLASSVRARLKLILSHLKPRPNDRNMSTHTSQHCCNMLPNNVAICCVGMLRSFGQGFKPRPNDRNMPTQHAATLLGATCCVRLANVLRCVAMCCDVLRCVAMCCDVLGVVGSNLTMVKSEPTTPNTSQHGGQTHATCCSQQCCDMLRWHVAIVWPGL